MKTKKIKLALLIGTLFLPFNTLALNKTETVYSNLDYNGQIAQSIVSNHLSFIGDKDIQDETELKEILNINGEETYKLNGDRLIWSNRGKDIFYRGTVNKKLPIEIEVEYYLNGNPEKLENMIGKEGHIKILYKLKNNQKNRMNINGHNETLYTPFMTTLGTIIKGENTKNITVENGKVINTGSRTIIVAVASPGLYESTKLEELRSLNSITLEFDTEKFELGTTYLISTPKLLSEKDISLFKKAENLKANIDKLEKNMVLIEKGAKELDVGANELKTGSNILSNSLKDAVTASKELHLGSQELNKSLKELKTALQSAQLEISKDSVEELLLLKNANTSTINSLVTSTGKTLDEIASIYTGNNLSSYTGTDTSLLKIKNTYELVGLLNKNNQAIETMIKFKEETQQKIEKLMKTLNETVELLEEGSTKLSDGMFGLELGLQKIYAGANELKIGSQKLSDGSHTLSRGTTTLKTEGIEKFGDYANTLKTYSDRSEALVSLSNKYAGFASSNSDETLFVYQIKSYQK